MTRKFLVFLLVIIASSALSDAQNMRFSYSYYAKRNSDGKFKADMDFRLDYDGGRSSFYCEPTYLKDSLSISAFGPDGSVIDETSYSRMVRITGGSTDATTIDYIGRHFTTYYRIATASIKGEGALELPAWRLSDEENQVNGYPCKKASAEYLGRVWNVWYTEDIPTGIGPWLLWGTPGLIVWAEDSEKNFFFCLTGAEFCDDFRYEAFEQHYMGNGSFRQYSYADFRKASLVNSRMRSDPEFQSTQLGGGSAVIVSRGARKTSTDILFDFTPLIPDEYCQK